MMALARRATLAESPIDKLLWMIPLKSHLADAAEADLRPSNSAPASSHAASHPRHRSQRHSRHVARPVRGEEQNLRSRCPAPAQPFPPRGRGFQSQQAEPGFLCSTIKRSAFTKVGCHLCRHIGYTSSGTKLPYRLSWCQQRKSRDRPCSITSVDERA
jgi:hypothetical protein